MIDRKRLAYGNHIEGYGYFNGTYYKLSSEMQVAMEQNDFLRSSNAEDEHIQMRYSKRMQGAIMLENIQPTQVLSRCDFFFKAGYYDLQGLC